MDKKTEFLGEFKDTTLQERLDAIKGNPVIFLGAESGYFFIGSKTELEASIDSIFEAMMAEMRKKREETISWLNSSRIRLASYIEQLAALDSQSWSTAEVRHIAQLGSDTKNAALRIATLIGRMHFADQYLAQTEGLRQRRTREPFCRDRALGDDGIVITIEGSERGKYWFSKEYKKNHPSFEIHFPDEPEETEESKDGADKS